MAVTCTTYQCNASMMDWSCPLSVKLTGTSICIWLNNLLVHMIYCQQRMQIDFKKVRLFR